MSKYLKGIYGAAMLAEYLNAMSTPFTVTDIGYRPSRKALLTKKQQKARAAAKAARKARKKQR